MEKREKRKEQEYYRLGVWGSGGIYKNSFSWFFLANKFLILIKIEVEFTLFLTSFGIRNCFPSRWFLSGFILFFYFFEFID